MENRGVGRNKGEGGGGERTEEEQGANFMTSCKIFCTRVLSNICIINLHKKFYRPLCLTMKHGKLFPPPLFIIINTSFTFFKVFCCKILDGKTRVVDAECHYFFMP